MNSNIYLIGFMGVGKSTVARALRKKTGMHIIEMDEMIADNNKMTIPEIFEKKGEKYFRNEEYKLLKEVGDKKGCIVSCGGGAATRSANVEEMKRNGKVILLTASPETVLKRVSSNDDRPLLKNNKNIDYIKELMEKRKAAYEAAADAVVSTDNKKADLIAVEILELL